MTSALHTYPEQEILHSCFHGVVTDASLLSHYQKLLRSDGEYASFRELVDLRAATGATVTPLGLISVGQLISEAYPDAGDPVGAVFVAPGDLAFGLSRMYQMLGAPASVSTHIYKHVHDALDVLEVTSTSVRESIERVSHDAPSLVWTLP